MLLDMVAGCNKKDRYAPETIRGTIRLVRQTNS